ncbi:MAG: hypothetical protein ACRCZD_18825 [Phycicoccus sp.]
MPDNAAADVGFAEFVAVLLVETLDSIVASHTSQEERLRALEAAAGLTPEEVAATTITSAMVDATVTELFPDGDGGTTVRTGGPVPGVDALDELGIELKDRPNGLAATDVTTIRNAVALFLARRHLASVQEVARRGVPRVLVEGGTLRAKLAFTTNRVPSGSATGAATRAAAPRAATRVSGSTVSSGLSPAVARSALAGLGVARLDEIDAARRLAIHPEVLDGIRDLRLHVRPPVIETEPGQPTDRADVFGEVEIRFRTEG